MEGPQALTVNTSGATTFAGAVGGSSPLASLTTNAGGTVAINGGAVTTTGLQRYNDAATLGMNTILTGTSITFGSSLNSTGAARNLTVHNSGNVFMAGGNGNILPLGAVVVAGSGGTTTINGVTVVRSLSIADSAHITGTLTASGNITASAGLTLGGHAKSTTGNVMVTGALTLSAGSNTLEGDHGDHRGLGRGAAWRVAGGDGRGHGRRGGSGFHRQHHGERGG